MAVIIECTGVPGVGKTTFLDYVRQTDPGIVFGYHRIVPRALRKAPNVLRRLYAEFLVMASYAFGARLTFGQHLFLFRLAMKSREGLIFRLNLFRNAVLKFAVNDYVANKWDSEIVFVDEGISHLPFLFQFSSHEDRSAKKLYEEFYSFLSSNRVLILDHGDADLEARLLRRGHRRLRGAGAPEVNEFIAENDNTLRQLSAALESTGIPFCKINLSDRACFSSQLQKVLAPDAFTRAV